jgi:hypothetical protein
MRRFGSVAMPGLLVLALLVTTGCSLSAGPSVRNMSESSSDSSNSSASSSRSSGGGKSAYRDDVRSYTAAHLKSGGSLEAFEKKLGEVARRHGVTDWEDDQTTYIGIGEGLSASMASAVQLATYKTHFSRSDPLKMEAIQRGFETRE